MTLASRAPSMLRCGCDGDCTCQSQGRQDHYCGGVVVSGLFVGMPSFPVAARVSTKDTRLRGNLTRATHTIRERRERAVGELADWAALRAAGAAIKTR